MNTTPQRHSLTGGSNAHLWLNCPAAPWLCKIVPVVETDAMRKGTELHAVAAKVLLNPAADHGKLPKIVREYVDAVMRHKAAELDIEREFICAEFPQAFATADAVWYGQPMFIDLKTGRDPVEAEGNPQLAVLAAFAGQRGSVTGAIFQGGEMKTAQFDMTIWYPKIIAALAKVYGDNPTPCRGDHCSKCRARNFCPAHKHIEAEW